MTAAVEHLLNGLALSLGYGTGGGMNHPGLSGLHPTARDQYEVFSVVLHKDASEEWRVGFMQLHAEAMRRGGMTVGAPWAVNDGKEIP